VRRRRSEKTGEAIKTKTPREAMKRTFTFKIPETLKLRLEERARELKTDQAVIVRAYLDYCLSSYVGQPEIKK
jgi:hypothetical protein